MDQDFLLVAKRSKSFINNEISGRKEIERNDLSHRTIIFDSRDDKIKKLIRKIRLLIVDGEQKLLVLSPGFNIEAVVRNRFITFPLYADPFSLPRERDLLLFIHLFRPR